MHRNAEISVPEFLWPTWKPFPMGSGMGQLSLNTKDTEESNKRDDRTVRIPNPHSAYLISNFYQALMADKLLKSTDSGNTVAFFFQSIHDK